MRNRKAEAVPQDKTPVMTVKPASWLLFSLPDEVEEEQYGFLERLRTCPPLPHAQELVHAFRLILRCRQGEDLPHWPKAVQASGLKD